MNIFKKRKAKRMIIGVDSVDSVDSLTGVSEKLKVLDEVLDLFGMRLGSFEVTCGSGTYTKVVLSVYFMKDR